jgi:hypothetical protein
MAALRAVSSASLPRRRPTPPARGRAPAAAAAVPTPSPEGPPRPPIGPEATVLVCGASRGIGLEFASQLLDRGCAVVAACRDPGPGSRIDTLKTTHANGGNLQVRAGRTGRALRWG